jgi:hypothetical protein
MSLSLLTRELIEENPVLGRSVMPLKWLISDKKRLIFVTINLYAILGKGLDFGVNLPHGNIV